MTNHDVAYNIKSIVIYLLELCEYSKPSNIRFDSDFFFFYSIRLEFRNGDFRIFSEIAEKMGIKHSWLLNAIKMSKSALLAFVIVHGRQ